MDRLTVRDVLRRGRAVPRVSSAVANERFQTRPVFGAALTSINRDTGFRPYGHSMKTSEIMRTPVVSVAPDCRVSDAVRLLVETNRRGLPVLDRGGELVGIVSEGDFLRRPEIGTEPSRRPWFDAIFGPGESAEAFAHAHGARVEEIMTRHPVVVASDAELNEAVALMHTHHISQIPVVSGTTVVGMIARPEMLAAIARQAEAARDRKVTTREDILRAIRYQSWAAGALVDVMLSDGRVQMWGVIVDASQRDALKVLVEGMPGIVEVADHLQLRGPPSTMF
jgi:CBS domain-containing protein